jgi:hypothetical protein
MFPPQFSEASESITKFPSVDLLWDWWASTSSACMSLRRATPYLHVRLTQRLRYGMFTYLTRQR